MGESAVSSGSIQMLFEQQKELFGSFFENLDYVQIHTLADWVRPLLERVTCYWVQTVSESSGRSQFLKCQGIIFFTGIGKSGFIAKKVGLSCLKLGVLDAGRHIASFRSLVGVANAREHRDESHIPRTGRCAPRGHWHRATKRLLGYVVQERCASTPIFQGRVIAPAMQRRCHCIKSCTFMQNALWVSVYSRTDMSPSSTLPGDTQELIMLAPYAKAKGAKLISITAKADSECAARHPFRAASAGHPSACLSLGRPTAEL